MKKKNKLNKIIATVLTLALTITGIGFSDITTAHAADDNVSYTLINCEGGADIENKTVTMKPGDIMRFQYIMQSGSLQMSAPTNNYTWECSDKTIATMNIVYWKTSAGTPAIDWIEIRAEKAGTATITGTHKNNGKTISFTVSVKAPKMTAKQKNCKHVWKTTRKATCVRNGMKACKKCKLEKVIKQKAHKFATNTEIYEVYETYAIYVCNACTCGEHVPTGFGQFVENPTVYCDALCGESFDAMDYDTNNNGFDVNDVQAAYEAFEKHKADNNHICPSLSQYEGYCNPKPVPQVVTRCKTCGQTPEQIKNSGQ